MPATITSSVVVTDQAQHDGRRWIHERHTDSLGKTYEYWWMAEIGAVATAQLAGHATQLLSDLAIAEIAANTLAALNQGVPALTFNYSTTAQGIVALQAFWQAATGWPAAQMGNYINSLALPDATLENIFGVTAGAQLTALKAVIAQCVSAYAAGSTAVGAA